MGFFLKPSGGEPDRKLLLLLNGERSPKLFGEMFTVMRQCEPDIPTPLIVPNGMHLMHRDNPEFFNKSVLDFLNQH